MPFLRNQSTCVLVYLKTTSPFISGSISQGSIRTKSPSSTQTLLFLAPGILHIRSFSSKQRTLNLLAPKVASTHPKTSLPLGRRTLTISPSGDRFLLYIRFSLQNSRFVV